MAVAQIEQTQRIEDLDNSSLYINRELSWLQFNSRVLEEALNSQHPLLERIKFLAIFANNLDEFFMVRLSGLCRQLERGVVKAPPDGMTPAEQLAAIREEVLEQLETQTRCWNDDLMPKLHNEGICLLTYGQLTPTQRNYVRRYFENEVFPVLTPLAFDPAHPFPHISSLSMNLAVVVNDPPHGERFARLKVPAVFPRLIRLPGERESDEYARLGLSEVKTNNFVWIEDVISNNLDLLFPGMEIIAVHPFRVTRDADFEIEEDEAADLLATIEEHIELRHFGSAVRLEVDVDIPDQILKVLVRNLDVAPYQVYTTNGPLGISSLMEIADVDRPDLKDPPFQPVYPEVFKTEKSIFSVIRRQNVLLYHPYDSFAPVVDFLREAAEDPDVLAIKQTLYRVGTNSPVVKALMEARENRKQVAVLVELKARFDEENNIQWARALEHNGVHVVYGLLGLKTHAKLCMVVRREHDGIRRYLHMATGNYNAITAQVYTDLGFFTCDPAMGKDVSDLFNALTGYSRQEHYRKLLVAPGNLRDGIIRRINREVERHEQHGDGYIAFKMNALVDKRCIQALYRASQAGVSIDLQVRGICCLRPGVPGLSENISVTSIVGRFLEHSRIYYFRNGGNEEMYLGSADLMPRNLDRRVESLFPIEDATMRQLILDDVLRVHLNDTAQARRLRSDGTYEPVMPADTQEPLDSQNWLIENWHRNGE